MEEEKNPILKLKEKGFCLLRCILPSSSDASDGLNFLPSSCWLDFPRPSGSCPRRGRNFVLGCYFPFPLLPFTAPSCPRKLCDPLCLSSLTQSPQSLSRGASKLPRPSLTPSPQARNSVNPSVLATCPSTLQTVAWGYCLRNEDLPRPRVRRKFR